MRQITQKIVTAFEQRRALKIDNSETDGTSLWLFNNKIAEHREGGIWITNAGWSSKTTKERLNGLRGVHITQKKGEWYLNGHRCGGEWVYLSYLTLPEEQSNEPEFDVTSEWNGLYSEPRYSVFHTNDETQLEVVENMLNSADIRTRRMYSDTQGMYKPNHFIVVYVADFDRAKNLIQ